MPGRRQCDSRSTPLTQGQHYFPSFYFAGALTLLNDLQFPNSSCCFMPLAFCPSCSFCLERLLPCLVSRVNTNPPFNTQSMCTSQGGLTFPSPLPLYSTLVSINLLIIFFYTINCNKSALLCPHCDFSKGRNRVLFTSEFPEPGTQRRPKYLLNW